jgi:Flp pilus assembly protein TadD
MTGAAAYARLADYLERDADNLELLAAAADAALDASQAERAIEHAQHALRIAPGHPQFSYRLAVALRRSRQPEQARDILTALTAAPGAHPVPLCELADLLFGRREFEACLEVLARLERADPAHRAVAAHAALLQTRALHHLGRIDEAIATAEAALADAAQGDAPPPPKLTAALATLYLDAERLTDAQRLHAAAVRAGEGDAELDTVGGFLALAAEDSALARRRFEAALGAQPDDARAMLGAGLSAAVDNDLPGAIARLQEATRAMPTHLGTWNALAWMQLSSGELDAAEASLQRARDIDPTFSETHGGLAVIAALRGDREGAQRAMQRAQRLDRGSFSAAYAALLLEHGPEAREAMLAAVLKFLARQPTEDGRSMREVVLDRARRSARP